MAGVDAEQLSDYDAERFPRFAVTVDVCVIAVADSTLVVLLGRRADQPFQGMWALPGGFKRPDESLDDAAQRVLAEEIEAINPASAATPSALGDVAALRQFGAYGDPGRDPRTNVVTVGYLATLPEPLPVMAGKRTSEAAWHAVDDVANLDVQMAFDHRRVVLGAIERVAADLDRSDLALSFVGETFTLTDLQEVFQAGWNTTLDPANFRRSVTADTRRPYVIATGQRGRPGPKGGQPPRLYRAGPAWRDGPPIRRP